VKLELGQVHTDSERGEVHLNIREPQAQKYTMKHKNVSTRVRVQWELAHKGYTSAADER